VCVGRELTKLHEEIIEGTAAELAVRFPAESAKGEFCLVVWGFAEKPSADNIGDDL